VRTGVGMYTGFRRWPLAQPNPHCPSYPPPPSDRPSPGAWGPQYAIASTLAGAPGAELSYWQLPGAGVDGGNEIGKHRAWFVEQTFFSAPPS